MKTRRSREKMIAEVNQFNQTTFDTLPVTKKISAQTSVCSSKKKIIISEIVAITREDELALKTSFRLLPSKAAYSKITLDLYFDSHMTNTTRLSIPQGLLTKDDFELTTVLNMKGISAGPHLIKVEMFELWSNGEKLASASKELSIEYVPIRREDRLVKIPIVNHIAGTDLFIVSDSDKGIYHQTDEDVKNEQTSRRDEW